MIDELWNEAKLLAARPYDVIFDEDQYPDGTIVFLARNPELPGCKAQGRSQPEATANLAEARIDYIYALLVSDLPIPAPNPYTQKTLTGQSSVPSKSALSGNVITLQFDAEDGTSFDSSLDDGTHPDSQKKSLSSQLGGDLVKHG